MNNEYYSKLEPRDVKSSSYVLPSKEVNDKNPKFKIGDIIRISKYKNIFTKGYNSNCLRMSLQ